MQIFGFYFAFYSIWFLLFVCLQSLTTFESSRRTMARGGRLAYWKPCRTLLILIWPEAEITAVGPSVRLSVCLSRLSRLFSRTTKRKKKKTHKRNTPKEWSSILTRSLYSVVSVVVLFIKPSPIRRRRRRRLPFHVKPRPPREMRVNL